MAKEKAEPKKEVIEHPNRYCRNGIEVWDVEKAFLGNRAFQDHLVAGAVEYLLRFRMKNGIEDVKKANFLTSRLIKELEENGCERKS